ncbi:hypothetical protein BG015_000759 [Linnemannia schmuckeri]|uniref:Transmembrane protein n=1 Tax=Linnemannia schmuckeri TaxID=64567 RepID=A0A9P5RU66_9FUNG|nr:hypothetical protein BG015_000759 [Linnemannia schmuckeri]
MVQQHNTRGVRPPPEHVSLKAWIRNAPWSQYFKDGCRLIVKSPFNFFVFFCCLSVVVWGAFLVLLMGNMVKLRDDATQKLWIEIASQVLNGFFTLANVPVHPKRFIGFVRGVSVWREDKAIQQQFIARFSRRNAVVVESPTAPTGESNQEEEKLLERLQFYRCFPGYGRERTETVTFMDQDTLVLPQSDSKEDLRSRTLDKTEARVVVFRSRSRSKSGARTIDPQRRSLSVELSRVSSSDPVAGPLHPVIGLDGQDSSVHTGSSSPSTASSATPTAPSSTTMTLRVDIAEEELNDLLTEETHRVVHSVVLPFLPFPLDVQTDDSSNDVATVNDATGQDTTESISRLEEGQGAMPLKPRVIQRGASYTALPRTSSSRRISPRTRARTMTMSMADDIPVSNESPRRPTFVIHEDHGSLGTHTAGTRSENQAGLGIMSAQSPPDEKSSKKKKVPPPPAPMPEALTQEQMDWVDEYEARLLRRKERLQRAWPWYNYTIPSGIEPVDFFAPPAEQHSSTTILLSSSPLTLVVSPARFLLIVGSFNLNSMIQEVLCGFMWGMNYHVRPGWVVGTGMAFGCLAAIVPSVLIMLHEQAMSRMRVVATAEEAIQDALDEKILSSAV